MPGPLDGVHVLDVSEYGFVPSSAVALADWGAEVLKVERTTGDPFRLLQATGVVPDTGDFNSMVEQANRNKRNIGLDVLSPGGRPILERLITWADVFVTSYLPSTRRKLRLEPDDVFAVNPSIVYARGHGYGPKGADADTPGFDFISYWARGGIADMLTAEGAPLVMMRGAMGDYPSGMYLAGGIAAALFQRERTGSGCIVDVSLLGAAVWTLATDIVPTTVLGEMPPKFSAETMRGALLGMVRTKDDRWVTLNMMDFARYWPIFCRAVGREDLVESPPQDVPGFVQGLIRSEPLAHWKQALTGSDCAWSYVQTLLEVIDDDQVVVNGYLPRHPTHESARLSASPVQFNEQPVEVRTAAGAIGQDTDWALESVGYSAEDIASFRAQGIVV